MPAWLLRLLAALGRGLLFRREEAEDRGPRGLAIVLGLVLLGPALVLMGLPVLIWHLPFAPDDTYEAFGQACRAVEQATDGQAKPPWDEVIAAWAAVHDQDFSGADPAAVEAFAWNWVEEQREEIRNDQGEVVDVIITYRLRPFDEVLDLLGLTPDQKEAARRYLATLRELLQQQSGQGEYELGPAPQGALTWPVPGYSRVSSRFGLRIHPVTLLPQFHRGIDIPAPQGTPVVAAHAGTVVETGHSLSLGNYVVLDGGGCRTRYGHLSAILVAEGQQVEAGQTIGLVGSTGISTGPHLHFEVIFGGKHQDPLGYFGR